jgi:hypothetical protein
MLDHLCTKKGAPYVAPHHALSLIATRAFDLAEYIGEKSRSSDTSVVRVFR